MRGAVYELDLLSKDLGLFPQTSKIKIHEVANIEDELKTVSRPDDEDFDWDQIAADQDRLHALLAELTPRHRVLDPTRFKYFLSQAMPRAGTNTRLWRVLVHHPELHGNILSYFRRYSQLPKRDAARLVAELRSEETHAVKIATMIHTAEGRLENTHCADVDEVVRRRWRQAKKLPADLAAALGRWGTKRGLLGQDQIGKAVEGFPEWYTRAVMVNALDSRAVPQPDLNAMLIARLADPVSDVAIAAAVHLGMQATTLTPNHTMHSVAGPVLSAFGVLDGSPRKVCGIVRAFDRLLGHASPRVDWNTLLGKTYREAEIKAVRWSGYLVDATAWVNLMDVFCDLLLDGLFRADPSLGGYSLGNIGSVLNNPKSRFALTYPKVYNLANAIHAKRGESDLSHAKTRRGGAFIKSTSYIKYTYFKIACRLVAAALMELAARWLMPTVAPAVRRRGR